MREVGVLERCRAGRGLARRFGLEKLGKLLETGLDQFLARYTKRALRWEEAGQKLG
jgi:hypothetical protein